MSFLNYHRSLVIVDASASLFPSSRSFRCQHCLRVSPQLQPTKYYRKVVPGNTTSRISRVLKRSYGLQKTVAVENRYGKCHGLVTRCSAKQYIDLTACTRRRQTDKIRRSDFTRYLATDAASDAEMASAARNDERRRMPAMEVQIIF